MLLLLAALLASAEPFIADVPESAAEEEAPVERTVEATVRAVASTRGEGRAEVSAHASAGGLGLTIGAAESAGVGAVQRQELSLGIEAGPFRGEARVVPQLGGLFRIGGELGVHFETWGLVLDGRDASIGATQLRAAGLRLEVEDQLAESVHAGASAAAWALQLDAPPSADPFGRYGAATLDWAQRWETGAWVSVDCGPLALTPSLSLSRPPQDGAYEAHASLVLEAPLGPAKLRAEAGAGRLFAQQLTLFEASAGITLSLR